MCVLLVVNCSYVYLAYNTWSTNQLSEMGIVVVSICTFVIQLS